MLKKISSKIAVFTLLFGMLFTVLLPTPVTAASGNEKKAPVCAELANPISIGQLFNPGNFTPIIPDSCPKPLPFYPDIFFVFARAYALIESAVLYLFTIMMVIFGLQMMVGGLSSEQQYKVKKNIKNAVFAVIIVLTAPVLVSEIMSLLLNTEKMSILF